MDEMNNKQQDMDIRDILTPKHLPECDMTFDKPKSKKLAYLLRCARIAISAAAFTAFIAIVTKNYFVEEACAAVSPMEIANKAIEKFAKQESLLMECKTRSRIKIGLPVTDEDKFVSCKLYFLKKDSIMYMREEWDDENKSIVVYDKDSMRLWQNGELQITLKIPFRPARYEAIFDLISIVLKKDGGIMNGLKQNMDGIFENNAISKKQIGDIGFVKLSEDGKTVRLETKPKKKYDSFFSYMFVFSVANEELVNCKAMRQKNKTSERIIWEEYMNFVYNYPITITEMMKAPLGM